MIYYLYIFGKLVEEVKKMFLFRFVYLKVFKIGILDYVVDMYVCRVV